MAFRPIGYLHLKHSSSMPDPTILPKYVIFIALAIVRRIVELTHTAQRITRHACLIV
jgi:hypothetical protein